MSGTALHKVEGHFAATRSHTGRVDGGGGGGGGSMLKVEPNILIFFPPLSKLKTYKIAAVKYYF